MFNFVVEIKQIKRVQKVFEITPRSNTILFKYTNICLIFKVY